LEGLEINIVNKKALERTIRIDSEFYNKLNMKVIETITKHNPKPASSIFKVSDGNHITISEEFTTDGVPYYRGGDIYNFFIEQSHAPLRIPLTIFNKPNFKRSHLKKGDLLVSIVGAIIGNVSLVKTDQKATCSCKLAILRPTYVKAEYAAIFFKTKFGKNQIQKFRRGSGQTGLILEDFNQILIPVISERFTEAIVDLVDKSFVMLDLSIRSYSDAECLLINAIGFNDFQTSSEQINIKSFKESFGVSGRLDAEYYQIKYEDYMKLITLRPEGWDRIEKICEIKDSNYNPFEESEYQYIELADIGKTGEITGCTIAKGIELPSRARRKVITGDVIISSIEGSLSCCAIVQAEFNEALCSTGFYVLRPTRINSETLLILFKSELLQNFLKQACSGTILTAINKNEFKNIAVPLIDIELQNNIASLVRESFQLKKQSEHLLDVAKRGVELAIEEGEDVALEWMETQNIDLS
jgi:restriction endonuclease S subunit